MKLPLITRAAASVVCLLVRSIKARNDSGICAIINSLLGVLFKLRAEIIESNAKFFCYRRINRWSCFFIKVFYTKQAVGDCCKERVEKREPTPTCRFQVRWWVNVP